MKYIIYDVQGNQKRYVTEKGLTLDQMQKIVGGYVEFVNLKDDVYACVNEEGRLKNLPINVAFPVFCGNVILGRMERGEFVGYNLA